MTDALRRRQHFAQFARQRVERVGLDQDLHARIEQPREGATRDGFRHIYIHGVCEPEGRASGPRDQGLGHSIDGGVAGTGPEQVIVSTDGLLAEQVGMGRAGRGTALR